MFCEVTDPKTNPWGFRSKWRIEYGDRHLALAEHLAPGKRHLIWLVEWLAVRRSGRSQHSQPSITCHYITSPNMCMSLIISSFKGCLSPFFFPWYYQPKWHYNSRCRHKALDNIINGGCISPKWQNRRGSFLVCQGIGIRGSDR